MSYQALQTSDFAFSYWDKFRCDNTQTIVIPPNKNQSVDVRIEPTRRENRTALYLALIPLNKISLAKSNNMKFILLQSNTTDKNCYCHALSTKKNHLIV